MAVVLGGGACEFCRCESSILVWVVVYDACAFMQSLTVKVFQHAHAYHVLRKAAVAKLNS